MHGKSIEGFRLSPQQKRIWLLFNNSPASKAFCAISFEGNLKAGALKEALQNVIERHEILRTVFYRPLEIDLPIQVITNESATAFSEIDLTNHAPRDQDLHLDSLVERASQDALDLEHGPIVRATLIKLTPQRHVLLLTLPSICGDGRTLNNLAAQLFQSYAACIEGRVLEDEPFQYVQFSEWQNELLQDEEAEAGADYWRNQKTEAAVTIALAYQRKPIERQEYGPKSFRIAIDPELVAQITAFCEKEGTRVDDLLLACWHTILWRLAREQDVVIGRLCESRKYEPLQSALGLFARYVPIAVRFDETLRFQDVLRKVSESVRQAYSWEEYFDWEQVIETRGKQDEHPYFSVGFSFEERLTTHHPVADLICSIRQQSSCIEKFNLQLVCASMGGALTAEFYFDPVFYRIETIKRVACYFETLLTSAISNPSIQVSDLEILSEAAKNEVLYEWNESKKEHPPDLFIHQLFQSQAVLSPDLPAASFLHDYLSYKQLNSRANQLAHFLAALGAAPDQLVAVCLHRSLDLLVALLAINKTGAAYLPLDPSYPSQRLAFILDDAQAPIIVTVTDLVQLLPPSGARVLCLDSHNEEIAAQSTLNLAPRLLPDNVAYVLYTSGSTGKPKGVMITHSALANHMLWMLREWPLDQSDRVLQKTPFGFDASVWEFYLPLLSGAHLVMAEPGVHRDSGELVKAIQEHQVTIIQLIPSLLAVMMQETGFGECKSLRRVFVGGEALTPAVVGKYHGESAGELINLYGPTETCIQVSSWKSSGEEEEAITIGEPIDNAQLYVLDEKMRPVGVGVAGELYIGGKGLARGYLGRAEMTAEKFLPNPYSEEGGERLYRTGDEGRYVPSGRIEFLGRMDFQTKIRGNLVELGEVEAVLMQHPAVRQAALLCREDEGGRQNLVAYIVQKPEFFQSRTASSLSKSRISQWQAVHDDEIVKGAPAIDEPIFNTSGWKSSYTGGSLSKEEMEEIVGSTVERIASMQPKSVLEIGCGAGLLLFRLAPGREQYYGTDFSQAALSYIRLHLNESGIDPSKVVLSQKEASDFEGMQPASFDGVILNSVIQYFPNVDYLLRVIEGALNVVKPGGFIFIGDVRSLPLLEAFHSSVHLQNAPPSLPVAELRHAVQRAVFEEPELTIDPLFFAALKERFPQVNSISVLPKRGRHPNEINQFRYDAILKIGQGENGGEETIYLDWEKHGLNLDSVRQLLIENMPEALGVLHVPNARLQAAVHAAAIILNGDALETVSDLRNAAKAAGQMAVDPEDIWGLSCELPYEVEVSWADSDREGRLNVLFTRRPEKQGRVSKRRHLPNDTRKLAGRRLASFANNPLQEAYGRELVPELVSALEEKLPVFMVPSTFVMMGSFPLQPNGKIDRRRLPAPLWGKAEDEGHLAQPTTPTEEILVGIWAEVLKTDKLGMHDNFFDLGGHSLLATQVMTRIREAFDMELPLRLLFESPTVAELAEAIETLGATGKGLLAPPIVPVSRDRDLPLSFAQQRLWFLDHLEPNSPFYNISAGIRLIGPFDTTAFELSLRKLVSRHEVLRTRFAIANGEPVQIIAPDHSISMSVIDLSELPEASRESEAQRIASEEAQRTFDLNQDLLFRATAIRLKKDEHLVVVVLHHIISDDWSTGIFVREASVLYEMFCSGKALPLPDLRIQYADFAHWQRNWLQGTVLDKQLDYWKTQLEGFIRLNLPTAHPRPAIQTYRGETIPFELSVDQSEAIVRLSRQEGVTPFMTLLAAFKTLLLHYGGQNDIAIGANIANRNHLEVEGLIGFFVNLLVLRTDLSGNPTFSELLRRVRAVTLGAYAHQDLPFDKLVEHLQPQRDTNLIPFVGVVFTFQNAPTVPIEFSGLSSESFALSNKTTRFDLTLNMNSAKDRLVGSVIYNTDLFNAKTISRLLANYELILSSVTRDRKVRLGELKEIITEAERQQRIMERKQKAQPRQKAAGSIDLSPGSDLISNDALAT